MAKQTVGWVSLHRQIQNHWIWKDANKLKWWLDMLLTVNSNQAKVNIGNDIFDCNRGESLISLSGWASRWNVSKDTARNFLKLLEKDNMIKCVSIGKSTRLTICNYDSYQLGLHVKNTHSVRTPNAEQTPTHPNNKEDNKDKENKRVFVPPSLEDVCQYFRENNYSIASAEKAFKYYDLSGWKDSNGKQVINWKQKMVAVWFKSENKEATTVRKLQY